MNNLSDFRYVVAFYYTDREGADLFYVYDDQITINFENGTFNYKVRGDNYLIHYLDNFDYVWEDE